MKRIFLNKHWQYFLLFTLLLLFIGKYFNNQPLTKHNESQNSLSTSTFTNNQLPTSGSEKNISAIPLIKNFREITATATVKLKAKTDNSEIYYPVIRIVDGDTIDVDIDGQISRIRLIGINTPEIVDQRQPVQCFGGEASNKAKELLTDQNVRLEVDNSQDGKDKYGRLLRYVWRQDGLFYNLEIIKLGFAFEYTYFLPYKYQAEFKAAQDYAENNKLGLWADNTCHGQLISAAAINSSPLSAARQQISTSTDCLIKGNINAKGEKIYHLTDCPYYNQTVIEANQGEKWFCTEMEAIATGWRKAQNCP